MKKRLNPLDTTNFGLGGALTGGLSQGASMAATGASLGSVIPGFGTGVGAIIGGGIGLLAGGITGHQEQKVQEDAQAEIGAAQERTAQTNYDAGADMSKISTYNESVNEPMNPLEQGHAMGGLMGGRMEGQGQIGNDDVNHYDEGGTHEQNPHGGIPQGMGENGKMNTVEEGEVSVKLNPDTKYIFSDRLIF